MTFYFKICDNGYNLIKCMLICIQLSFLNSFIDNQYINLKMILLYTHVCRLHGLYH